MFYPPYYIDYQLRKNQIYIFAISLLFVASISIYAIYSHLNNLIFNDNGTFYYINRYYSADFYRIDNAPYGNIRINLHGVKTSENNDPEIEKESLEFVKELIDDDLIRIVYRKDEPENLLVLSAYVFNKDGKFINAEIIRRGYAAVSPSVPNDKYGKKILKAEREAKRKRVGIWK